MPTYSYRCTECGTAFDIQQAFADDSLTECPTCGGKLRKLFSAVGVSFTGSGFYRNDSRAGQKKSESTVRVRRIELVERLVVDLPARRRPVREAGSGRDGFSDGILTERAHKEIRQ